MKEMPAGIKEGRSLRRLLLSDELCWQDKKGGS